MAVNRRSEKQSRIFKYFPPLLFTLTFFIFILTTVSITANKFTWVAWISLFPLLIAIRFFSPFWAAVSGCAWGLGMFLFLRIVPSTDPPIPFTISSAIVLAIIPACYACIGRLLTRWIGFHPLILALGWIGLEAGLKAVGLHDGLLMPFDGMPTLALIISGIFGYNFIGFFIIFTSASVLDFACTAHFRPIRFEFLLPIHEIITTSFHKNSSSKLLSFVLKLTNPRAPPIPSLHADFHLFTKF